MLQKFKEFAFKGNVIDLSVGVIIGGAFGKIVSSLVSDIIMPFIGVISGGIDFQGLSVTVGEAVITRKEGRGRGGGGCRSDDRRTSRRDT